MAGTRSQANRYVALFRGLSLGNKQVPMDALVALFVDLGCTDVRHYIRSGNVVFRASAALAAKIPAALPAALAAEHGFTSAVVLRTGAEMAVVAKKHPFASAAATATKLDLEKALHVGFLAEPPSKARLATLDPQRSPPDVFSVQGREIFLLLPNGVARSKLTNAYFDSKLGTISTFRNWRTVQTLAQMAQEP